MSGYYQLKVSELQGGKKRLPFLHQEEAFAELARRFPFPAKGYKGTILVLPTGGGKTYTAASWLCRHALPRGAKVLWMAQSAYLLDQAARTFFEEMHNVDPSLRAAVNLRVVSSSKSHSSSGSIRADDDVLVCTVQTAVLAWNSEQTDGRGAPAKTPFRRFVEACRGGELVVVVDEAHHAPAYGCRTLLTDMKKALPNLYVLGLTATPTYGDRRYSGWLKVIFDCLPWHEAKTEDLQARKILAVPKYIQKDTGQSYEVAPGLFDRLVNKHRDLPEDLIGLLAGNHRRNDRIVSDYLDNRGEYGKTLIFADRWAQCEYIVGKLRENGVRAEAVYSTVSANRGGHTEGSGRRDNRRNEEIMERFRAGGYDVLVNVRMLTEGVDVPDVKTVMVTRQTTSPILLTQMIGRALRGERTGGEGKGEANIVFFHDSWQRVLPFARADGDALLGRPPAQGRDPMQLVSVHLVKMAVEDIRYEGFERAPFLTFVPVGFYSCEYTVAVEEETLVEEYNEAERRVESRTERRQGAESFAERVSAYSFNKEKYDATIAHAMRQDLGRYSGEDTDESLLEGCAKELAAMFFDGGADNMGGQLAENIGRMVRHIAQNGTEPVYTAFADRDLYDLDALAQRLMDVSQMEAGAALEREFHDESKPWKAMYRDIEKFRKAYANALARIWAGMTEGAETPAPKPAAGGAELTAETKAQVLKRDRHRCRCCYIEKFDLKPGARMEADHIRPVSMQGGNEPDNLQTLCCHCNRLKGSDEMDFRARVSPLASPPAELATFPPSASDDAESAVIRIANRFYRCGAVFTVSFRKDSISEYSPEWTIYLRKGNDPKWLRKHHKALLAYAREHFGIDGATKITVRN